MKLRGFVLGYNRFAVLPEIPRVADVMRALQKTEQEEAFDASRTSPSTYSLNVMLVAEAVRSDVAYFPGIEGQDAEWLIARAIIELCPEEARCLLVGAYVAAKRSAGETVEIDGLSRAQIRRICTCERCRRSFTPLRPP